METNLKATVFVHSLKAQVLEKVQVMTIMEAVNTGNMEAKVVETKLEQDLDAMNMWL